MTVRYWAAARAAAGVSHESVQAATLAEALAAVRAARPGDRRFSDVVSICSVLVGEVPVASAAPEDVTLADGDTVELLPPFAGG